jgi:hypothetical protein
MPAFALVVPVVPGKEEADRALLQEMAGPRREEYLRSRQRGYAFRHRPRADLAHLPARPAHRPGSANALSAGLPSPQR